MFATSNDILQQQMVARRAGMQRLQLIRHVEQERRRKLDDWVRSIIIGVKNEKSA